MASPNERGSESAREEHVTTKTGRILSISQAEAEAAAAAATKSGSPAVSTMDPARRTDVLFRVRRDEGHEISSWWMIGAFLVTSGVVIALLYGVPSVA
jgi:hypothetical protein